MPAAAPGHGRLPSGPDRHAQGFTRSNPIAVSRLDDPPQDAHVETRARPRFLEHPTDAALDDRGFVQQDVVRRHRPGEPPAAPPAATHTSTAPASQTGPSPADPAQRASARITSSGKDSRRCGWASTSRAMSPRSLIALLVRRSGVLQALILPASVSARVATRSRMPWMSAAPGRETGVFSRLATSRLGRLHRRATLGRTVPAQSETPCRPPPTRRPNQQSPAPR